MNDPLHHFVQAQQDTYQRACTELAAGEKQTHWMWFIFPQLAGLGQSSMARRYAIASLAQAADYLQHPILGPRLHTITHIVNEVQNRSIAQIFGYPDDLKFHSSITLFTLATDQSPTPDLIYRATIAQHFGSRTDQGTIRLLAQHALSPV